jgi:acetyl esterase/lipase
MECRIPEAQAGIVKWGSFMTNRRDFLRAGSTFVLASACGAGVARAAAGVAIDPLSLVDPELRPAALTMRAGAGGPPLSDESLPQVRLKIAATTATPLAGVPYVERMIPGPAGAPQVRIYIINALAGAGRPCVVYMHGGGFIFGDARSTIRELQALAIALNCTVVTVDYRLAPETTYAGSVEDNYAALLWTHKNAAELGIDPQRIAVMGESAGGGHAALLAIAARDRGEVPLLFQVLVYPMLDDRTGSSRPMPDYIGAIGWNTADNRYGWKSFLGRSPGGKDVPAAAVPVRNPNLAGLPPAFIGVGTIDLFVDEDIEYARRLADAGIPVELHVVPGAYHGFDHTPAASIALRFYLAKLDAMRRAFSLAR